MVKAPTATEIKRHVGENLYLADRDGAAWAANRYWLAPAGKIAPLLEKFNVEPTATGAYDVNGTVRKRSEDAPKVAAFLTVGDYSEPLTRLQVNGAGNAYGRTHDGHYTALFTRGDGGTVTVRADWLDWLSEPDTASLPYGDRYGAVRYATRERDGGAVAIIADHEVSHGGHNGSDGKFVPRTWENAGPVILAVVMPVKLQS